MIGKGTRKRDVNMTNEELQKIIDEREAWIAEAKERDLHGSAKELQLTVYLAKEVLNLRALRASGQPVDKP